MATRKFSFPLSVLAGAGRRLYDAMTDADYAAALADRLNAETDTPADNFATRFNDKLTAFGTGDSSQKLKSGQAGTLTKSQNTAFQEMERLLAGARRSAKLAFPGDSVKLHNEFQVGQDDSKTMDAELERAGIVLASCRLAANAPALKAQGWVAKDSDALAAAIKLLSDSNLDKTEALDDRVGLTSQKITAANAVYADALRIQNAARLEYPANKPGTEAARARFVLDEFPPRDRSEPSGGTQPPPASPVHPQS